MRYNETGGGSKTMVITTPEPETPERVLLGAIDGVGDGGTGFLKYQKAFRGLGTGYVNLKYGCRDRPMVCRE